MNGQATTDNSAIFQSAEHFKERFLFAQSRYFPDPITRGILLFECHFFDGWFMHGRDQYASILLLIVAVDLFPPRLICWTTSFRRGIDCKDISCQD